MTSKKTLLKLILIPAFSAIGFYLYRYCLHWIETHTPSLGGGLLYPSQLLQGFLAAAGIACVLAIPIGKLYRQHSAWVGGLIALPLLLYRWPSIFLYARLTSKVFISVYDVLCYVILISAGSWWAYKNVGK
jgi:hypothetical protein